MDRPIDLLTALLEYIELVKQQWRNQTPGKPGHCPGIKLYCPTISTADLIKSREITIYTYSSKMIAFPVKLQLRHVSLPTVALRDYPGTFP